MRYIDKIQTIKPDNPDNALFLGTAIHTGLEKNVETAIKEYFENYPVITDEHENEAIKLEYQITEAKKIIPKGDFEVKILSAEFIGFIDLLVSNEDGTFDIYDFKYSNNGSHYKDSVQLHLYKYYYEKTTGNKTRNLFFLMIPKVSIKQKKTETLFEFRKRLQDELKATHITRLQIKFDIEKVHEFQRSGQEVVNATEYPKYESWLCNYCEYQNYCKKGEDYMNLPSKERRNIEEIKRKVFWIYGSPFSGKTTFANKFPDPLMLNTDGNIKFVDAPYISIKDEIKVNGRMTTKTLAWQIFKDVIAELEKKDNEFKTIIVDLLEDTYEYCRLYMYDQMGITHESDDSFKAWDKVRTEFLSTLKRLMALDYENIILISHEDTSKDVTKKGGDKITSIKPNLQDKVANKVAGMVDIVARVIADDNKRVLSFKTNEVIFGGGRLTTNTNEIDLDYNDFLVVYDEANKTAVKTVKDEEEKPKTTRTSRKKEVIEKIVEEEPKEEVKEESKNVESENSEPFSEPNNEATTEEPKEEVKEEVKPRTRKRRDA